MTAFLLPLFALAGVLLAAAAAGWLAGRALFPSGRVFVLERIGWSLAAGCFLLAAPVPIVFLLGASPGWVPFLLGGALIAAAAHFLPLPPGEGRGEGRAEATAPEGTPSWVLVSFCALLLFGVAVYLLRALTEPMWSNDFLAIWGLKGKTIFFSRGLPARLYDWPPIRFSHPEYPLGLPFLFAGISFLTGAWDDHAMALVFPLVQIATLCVLCGWLRRRGASKPLASIAGALVALFAPLYSAFLTGMAEIPLAFGLLLFGTALADSFDETDPGTVRRLAVAAAFIAATKNEGLFLAALGFGIALPTGGKRRVRIAVAALGPALAVYGLHAAWRGRAPLSDFDFSLFSPARAAEALSAAARVAGLAGWAGLAALAVLIAAGARTPSVDRLLALAACALCAYVVLSIFAVRGPAWLVETTLLRTASALAPLTAAAVAFRLDRAFRSS
ncbi:MAG: hypothetical protein ACRD00_08440 [Thermoanaerobaculia bacterium]